MNFIRAILSVEKNRSIFYLLPLFIQWLPGLLYEKTPLAQRAARHGLVLFLLFLGSSAALYLFTSLVEDLAHFMRVYVGFFAFLVQSVTGLAYLFGSLYLANQYRVGGGENYILDRIYRMVEDLLQP